MMKKLILLLIFIIGILRTGAAQDPLYTQFMTNPFLINPAICGTYTYYQIIANSRLQWTGISDAPVTNVLSMYGPMVNQPMGLGGYVMHDSYGLVSNTKLSFSYAYHYAITEDLKISMGANLGFFQYKIDGTGTTQYEDPAYGGQEFTSFGPDATLGVYVYSSTYNGGLSLTNLFGNKLRIGDTITGLSRLKRNFYLHGGYRYNVNREFAIEPNIILRKVGAIPLQMDIDVRAWYGKREWNNTKLWGGLTFRTGDAVSILLGFTYQRKIDIGYSYDLGINKIAKFNNGSHELMIGFKFNDIKKY